MKINVNKFTDLLTDLLLNKFSDKLKRKDIF